MRVLVFGNPLLKNDSLPIRLLPSLKKHFPDVDFVETDPADIDVEKGKLIVIDTAKGIKEVTLLDDISKLESDSMLSMHGLGLAEQLVLMEAAGQKVKLKIICVPEKISQKLALEGITKILKSI